jgi:hypothetical protein
MYGCGTTLSGSPIGGGVGFLDLWTPDQSDVVADTGAQLRARLGNAHGGQVIYVADQALLTVASAADMMDPSGDDKAAWVVPDNVTLCGGRGRPGITPAILQHDGNYQDYAGGAVIRSGAGARVAGLVLRGNRTTREKGHHWQGADMGDGSEFCNNEVFGFPNYAVSAWHKNDVWIHHNSIHHCQLDGSGYGVNVIAQSIFNTASALIEGNIFDYCRHVVADQSGRGSYVFRYNYLGPNAAYEGALDCHGQNDTYSSEALKKVTDQASPYFGEYIQCAGDVIEIYNNTSACTIANGADQFVAIRGVPWSQGLVSVHHNWLKAPGRSGKNIWQWMNNIPEVGYRAYEGGPQPFIRMESFENQYGESEPPAVTLRRYTVSYTLKKL